MSAVAQLSDAPVRADEGMPPWTPATNSADTNLLHGLAALADLLSNASETLNQCVLTIEDTLRAVSTTQEEWVPIRTTYSAVQTGGDDRTPQECIFGGVPVAILKVGVPQSQQAGAQWEYQLGYSRVGNRWALMVRTASLQPSNENEGFWQFSDVKLLRDAPLEIRFKAIREIPNLMKLLDSRGLPIASDVPITADPLETCIEAPQTVEGVPQTC